MCIKLIAKLQDWLFCILLCSFFSSSFKTFYKFIRLDQRVPPYTLRPPTPFNMSLSLLSLRIALFLHLSSPMPLPHYVHILIGPFSSSPRFHPYLVFFSPRSSFDLHFLGFITLSHFCISFLFS